jgi:tripartite-type tricarboxylate transporter receptor subunit TctC
MKARGSLVILVLFFVTSFTPRLALSLDYPKREIEFVVAFAVGGNTDNFGRLAAKFGEKYVGKPIVVVNKPGGGGARGFGALAAAKPDGYTIGLLSNSVIAHPYLLKGTTYHYKKDFRVISQIDFNAEGLIVKKGGPLTFP